MAFVKINTLKWLPVFGAALLTGCTIGPIQMAEEKVETVAPKEEAESCPSCRVEKPALPMGDCAKAVAVVNYADSCQACGRFPVTVRAYGQAENCK